MTTLEQANKAAADAAAIENKRLAELSANDARVKADLIARAQAEQDAKAAAFEADRLARAAAFEAKEKEIARGFFLGTPAQFEKAWPALFEDIQRGEVLRKMNVDRAAFRDTVRNMF
jgi:membrane protein involved in colicin uptake